MVHYYILFSFCEQFSKLFISSCDVADMLLRDTEAGVLFPRTSQPSGTVRWADRGVWTHMASAVLELVSGNYRDVEKENQRSYPFPQTVMVELVCAGWKGGSWKNICLQVAARIDQKMPLTFLHHCSLSLGFLFYFSESYEWDEYFTVLVTQPSLIYC